MIKNKSWGRALCVAGTALTLILGNTHTIFAAEGAAPNDVLFLYEQQQSVMATGSLVKDSQLNLSALSAVLLDAQTGQVIYAKNAHQARPIASTTKIITALVAIELGQLHSMATVSSHAAGTEGSSVYLRAGEKLTLEELLYGALMRSGNDACVAIAEHVAGSEQNFVSFMNFRAHQLGAKNSRFCNTNGLPHDRHLASAYDLALITRHALQNPIFGKIVATKTHSIAGTQGKRQLSNTNKMLWSYQGADGVKTGTTNAAGRCLVASATRDGRQLIAVVLHSDNRWRECIKLLDYGFSQSENHWVAQQGEKVANLKVQYGVKSTIPVTVAEELPITLPLGGAKSYEQIVLLQHGLEAPIQAGQRVGELQVLVEGERVAGVPLVTLEGVEPLAYPKILREKILDQIQKTMSASP